MMATLHGSITRSLSIAALFYLALAGAVLLYWPGLNGPFVLDDEPHLATLGGAGAVREPADALRFALEGTASVLGRPLAMLSFLVNDNAWPTTPWSFKYTNLMLHLLCGTLLFWLVLRIARTSPAPPADPQVLALLAAGIWLVHPFNVSTVLYVIQRMAELSALFTLGGLLAYVHGRTVVLQRPASGYLWMTLGIGAGTLLATLSKENGALLPLYALAIEFCLLRPFGLSRPVGWSKWALVFLFVPVLALVAYLGLRFDDFLGGYRGRTFDMGDRLLTQPRVLIDYLSHTFVPRRLGTGVYHDDFAPSAGLFDPPLTVLALLACAALVALAIAWRRRLPVFSFAVLWFFGGHALEAGPIPLELYFEHRNYLPMVGPLFALVWYGARLVRRLPVAGIAALGGFAGLSAIVTWQTTALWSNGLVLANVWAAEHPQSVRAHQYAAHFWTRYGNYDNAERHLRHILAHTPDSTGTLMGLIQLSCVQNRDSEIDPKRTAALLRTGARDTAGPQAIGRTVELLAQGRCPGLSAADLHVMVDSLLANPRYGSPQDQAALYYYKARIHAAQRHLDPAIRSLQTAFARYPDVDIALTEAEYLVSAGLLEDALAALERAQAADRGNALGIGFRSSLLDNWISVIRAQLAARAADRSPPSDVSPPGQ